MDTTSTPNNNGMLLPIIATLVTVLLLLLSGCKSVQYVPVEKVKTVYQNHTDTIKQIDSVFSMKETIIREADSTLIQQLGIQLKKDQKAIVVFKTNVENKVKKEIEHKIDTVLKTDSIQVPYPVEKKISKWDKICLGAGYMFIGVCIVSILIVIMRFSFKRFLG